jgi:hypothetical protein
MANVRQQISSSFLLLDTGSERSGIRDGKMKTTVVPDPWASNIELQMIRFFGL